MHHLFNSGCTLSGMSNPARVGRIVGVAILVMASSVLDGAAHRAGAQGSINLAPIPSDVAKRLFGTDYVGSGPGPHVLTCPKHKMAFIGLAANQPIASFRMESAGGDNACYCSPVDPKDLLYEWVRALKGAASGETDSNLSPRAKRIRANADRYVKDVAGGGVPKVGDRAFDVLQHYSSSGSLSPPPGGTQSFSEKCFTLGQLKKFARSLQPLLRMAAAQKAAGRKPAAKR